MAELSKELQELMDEKAAAAFIVSAVKNGPAEVGPAVSRGVHLALQLAVTRPDLAERLLGGLNRSWALVEDAHGRDHFSEKATESVEHFIAQWQEAEGDPQKVAAAVAEKDEAVKVIEKSVKQMAALREAVESGSTDAVRKAVEAMGYEVVGIESIEAAAPTPSNAKGLVN